MKQRRGGAPPKGQPQAQGKTRRAKSAAPPRVPSPWQEAPPELITILERLLAMEDGNRWVSGTCARRPISRRRRRPLPPSPVSSLLTNPAVLVQVRVASHVCSFWRATAQEVLLADTAISKPPLEECGSAARCPLPLRRCCCMPCIAHAPSLPALPARLLAHPCCLAPVCPRLPQLQGHRSTPAAGAARQSGQGRHSSHSGGGGHGGNRLHRCCLAAPPATIGGGLWRRPPGCCRHLGTCRVCGCLSRLGCVV